MKNTKNTEHLHKYIAEQDTDSYTPIEHATWRFIMRQLKSYLSKHAHPFYLKGLDKAGITTESIPSIKNMSTSLKEVGWKTVPVSGFLPPAAFLEMQSLGFLPIAKEIRSVDHIPYTPAPDIVHEAAGHAPYLAHADFSNYLHAYANVANKAIISSEDYKVYSAIRKLSDIKEKPNTSKEEIQLATNELEEAVNSVTYLSEASKASRLYWWTAEYGLVGELEDPKIYGAGLLSSIGEAKSCLKKNVKKIPLSLNCLDYAFDITEMQPQLFVAKDFSELSTVLNKMADTFSFKKGGLHGVNEAIRAKTITTCELDSGLQISGQLEKHLSQSKIPFYIKTNGATQLAYQDQELDGHSKDYHADGYSTVLGKWTLTDKQPSSLSEQDLEQLGIKIGSNVEINYSSGVNLKGELVSRTFKDHQLLLLTFKNCKVTYKGEILFAPEWGMFDLAVASEIVSVFGGPADFSKYGDTEDFEAVKITKASPSDYDLKAYDFYQRIKEARKSFLKKGHTEETCKISQAFYDELKTDFPNEWLACVELYELSFLCESESLKDNSKKQLDVFMKELPHLRDFISDAILLAKDLNI